LADVLDLFFVILSDYLFPSREKERRSECMRKIIFFFSVWVDVCKKVKNAPMPSRLSSVPPTYHNTLPRYMNISINDYLRLH